MCVASQVVLYLIWHHCRVVETHPGIRKPAVQQLSSKTAPVTNVELAKRMLVRWIIEDHRPMSIVSTDAFKRFYSAVVKGSKPIQRRAVAARIVSLGDTVRQRLLSELKTVTFVAVTTDGWLSPQNCEYVCAVVHYITKDWELRYRCIGIHDLIGDSTADSVRGILQSMFTEYGVIPHTVTCDQGRNFANAVDAMKVVRVVCAAHNINLCVNDLTHDGQTHIEKGMQIDGMI